MLHQTLGDIDRETKHRLKCISQDQQVAARKLTTLERRLLISQSRSHSAASAKEASERRRIISRLDTCDSNYFKSLMTPAVKDTAEMFQMLESEQFDTERRESRHKSSMSGAQHPPKSALKKSREGDGELSASRRKSVSFNSK